MLRYSIQTNCFSNVNIVVCPGSMVAYSSACLSEETVNKAMELAKWYTFIMYSKVTGFLLLGPTSGAVALK
jgi:hypothetical protein